MHFRQLGSTGMEISEIGIGTWEMSGDVWGPTEDEQSLRAIQAGVDGGANFIDTAAGYGAGHVEELVGEFLRVSAERDRIVVSTKIKPECGQFAPPPGRPIEEFYSEAWIRSECERSLRRLGRDYIDVLFLHTWSRSWDHETGWLKALTDLKQEGKARAIGISVPDEGVTDANTHIALGQIDVVQCVYSVFQQEPEHSLLPLARDRGVGVIARSPFSSGVLVQDWHEATSFPSGDWRGSWPLDIKPGWLEDQVQMARRTKPVLGSTGLPFSTAALRFLLRQPAVSAVIPGSANPVHVAENVAASNGEAIDGHVVATLERLWAERAIHGTYNGSI
jgi:aryl-alcohol dehydrogenase-like predicted oxidoreductase